MSFFQRDLLSGRTALVTGGGSGICRGIAIAFAAHGARVALVGRTQDKLDIVAEEIAALGGDALPVAADVRHPDRVAEAVERAVDRFGALDLLVNGAAGNFLAPAAQLSPNGFHTVVEIDLCGTFNVSRAAFEHLAKAGGSVINITANFYGGVPLQSHASAAKAGIESLTRTLAVEWGGLGIRVNAISPGPIADTEGMRRLAPGEVRDKVTRAVPLGRFGTIDEVAQCALFLASGAASFVTGAVLVVDGGQWLPPAGFTSLL